MSTKKIGQNAKKSTVVKTDDYRVVYSNVQSWATTDNDLILTFLRVEPQVPGGATGSRFDTSAEHFEQEVTVYLALPQAKTMAEGILASIAGQLGSGQAN